MTSVLIGGGALPPSVAGSLYEPFLTAAGANPAVACLIVDEGDGLQQYARFSADLTSAAPCRPAPVLVPIGATLSMSALDGFSALLVCGGLTPAYATAVAPVVTDLREWLGEGRPYAGFSAGSAIAASRAVVGGYRLVGRAVCPEDTAEDLDEITVVDGLGLVPFAVDVHAAQWGTLGRMCAVVAAGLVQSGVAIDEQAAVVASDGSYSVIGSGAAHVVTSAASGVSVRSIQSGGSIPLG
jgi:cyanophycinase